MACWLESKLTNAVHQTALDGRPGHAVVEDDGPGLRRGVEREVAAARLRGLGHEVAAGAEDLANGGLEGELARDAPVAGDESTLCAVKGVLAVAVESGSAGVCGGIKEVEHEVVSCGGERAAMLDVQSRGRPEPCLSGWVGSIERGERGCTRIERTTAQCLGRRYTAARE